MKNCLKSIGILFALTLMFCIMPATVFADGTTSDGLKYSLNNSTKEITITGYEGADSNVTIPAAINTYDVTIIGKGAFEENNTITSVTFAVGSKVERIESYAFSICKNLKSINLPTSLKVIEGSAFRYCTALESIVIPEGTEKLQFGIYHGTFEGCTLLQSVQLPSTLKDIQLRTFYGCSSLKEINIPSGLTSLGEGAFSGTAITSIELPDGITQINKALFENCTSLQTVKMSENVKGIGARAFKGCNSLTSIKIPKDLTGLFGETFRGCSSLESLEFGDAVAHIYNEEFTDCPLLNVRVVKGTLVETFCINNDVPFTIYASSLGGCRIDGITDKTYTGKEIKQNPVITDGSQELVNGTHYTLSYTNNINAGKVTVTITGTGNYVGTVQKSFWITPADISKCTVKLSKITMVYNSNYLKPGVTVTFNGKKISPSGNYYVSYYSNRYVGTAIVTISGTGNFQESKELSFTILPKAVKLKKLKAGSKSFKASWVKNDIQTTGYQLQYSLKKNLSGAKTVTIKDNRTVSKKISKLKAKKTYYARVRCFRKTYGKNYYSAWSNTLKVKTKK